MLGRNITNNEHQENGALPGPLISTLPACSFVVVLSFNWLDGTDRAVVAPKKRGLELSDNSTENSKEFAGALNKRQGAARS
jgi:hypothetical protein